MTLTQRETEIVKLVSEGNSYKQIVRIIGLSLPTIKVYIRAVKTKLGAKNTAHAIAIFIRASEH